MRHPIYITDTRWKQPLVQFAQELLSGCCIFVDEGHAVRLVPKWEGFSSTEEFAWEIVKSMEGGFLGRFVAQADKESMASLCTLFLTIMSQEVVASSTVEVRFIGNGVEVPITASEV